MIRSFVVIASLAVAVLATACTKNADNPAGPFTSANNRMTVNGSGYSAASFNAFNIDTASVATVQSGRGVVTMTGITSKVLEGFSIVLTTPSPTAGTWQVNALTGTTMSLVISNGDSTRTYVATSGSVQIDSWGDRAKGQFSGSFARTSDLMTTELQVTAGKFDAGVIVR